MSLPLLSHSPLNSFSQWEGWCIPPHSFCWHVINKLGQNHDCGLCLFWRSFFENDFLEAQETRQAIADTEAADSDVAEASGAEMDLLAEMVNRAGVGLKGFRGDFNLYQGDVPPVVERGKGGAWLMANLASEDLWEVITAAMSSRVSDEDEGN